MFYRRGADFLVTVLTSRMLLCMTYWALGILMNFTFQPKCKCWAIFVLFGKTGLLLLIKPSLA